MKPGRPAAARLTSIPPTVVVLGNTTVRIIPTAGGRLRPAHGLEFATQKFCALAPNRLPARLRALLARPLAVCSVQREALRRLRRLARATGAPVYLYGTDFGPGLPVRLPRAAQKTVGRDRLAAGKAALTEFPAGALVCDVGTALTINRVSRRGFEGGLIAPGLNLALAALHQGTSQLPAVRPSAAARFPAKNTPATLQAGALYAVAGAIEKVYRAEARRRPGLPLILTGGGAIILRRLLTPRGVWRPLLVAAGVWAAFRESFAGRRPR